MRAREDDENGKEKRTDNQKKKSVKCVSFRFFDAVRTFVAWIMTPYHLQKTVTLSISFHVRGNRKSRRLNFLSTAVESELAVLKEFTPLNRGVEKKWAIQIIITFY